MAKAYLNSVPYVSKKSIGPKTLPISKPRTSVIPLRTGIQSRNLPQTHYKKSGESWGTARVWVFGFGSAVVLGLGAWGVSKNLPRMNVSDGSPGSSALGNIPSEPIHVQRLRQELDDARAVQASLKVLESASYNLRTMYNLRNPASAKVAPAVAAALERLRNSKTYQDLLGNAGAIAQDATKSFIEANAGQQLDMILQFSRAVDSPGDMLDSTHRLEAANQLKDNYQAAQAKVAELEDKLRMMGKTP